MDKEKIRQSAYRMAQKYDYEEAHAECVRRLACMLFDGLCGLHALGDDQRVLLECAALLHDIGRYRADKEHNIYSRDMIRRSALAVTAREKEIIAMIACFHRGAVPQDPREWSCSGAIGEDDYYNIQACSALIRIADGLERRHSSCVRALEAHYTPEIITIIVFARDEGSIETRAALKKADLCEAVWGRSLCIDWRIE